MRSSRAKELRELAKLGAMGRRPGDDSRMKPGTRRYLARAKREYRDLGMRKLAIWRKRAAAIKLEIPQMVPERGGRR